MIEKARRRKARVNSVSGADQVLSPFDIFRPEVSIDFSCVQPLNDRGDALGSSQPTLFRRLPHLHCRGHMVGTGFSPASGFPVGGCRWLAFRRCAAVPGVSALRWTRLRGTRSPFAALGGKYNFRARILIILLSDSSLCVVQRTVGFAAPVSDRADRLWHLLRGVCRQRIRCFLSVRLSTICMLVVREMSWEAHSKNASTFSRSVDLGDIARVFMCETARPAGQRDGAFDCERPFRRQPFWVMFAYSGWNASTYIVGELRNPSRTIRFSDRLGHVNCRGTLPRHECHILRTRRRLR